MVSSSSGLESSDLLLSGHHPSFLHLSQSGSPCLNHHLNTLLDSKQGTLGHNLGWTVLFHNQVGIQGTGWLTGSCLEQLILYGRQQFQGTVSDDSSDQSPLAVFFVIWAEEGGDGLEYLAACLVGEGVLL